MIKQSHVFDSYIATRAYHIALIQHLKPIDIGIQCEVIIYKSDFGYTVTQYFQTYKFMTNNIIRNNIFHAI